MLFIDIELQKPEDIIRAKLYLTEDRNEKLLLSPCPQL